MATTKSLALVVLAGILSTSLIACASTPTQKSAGEVIDDSVLTAKVKAKLLEDPQVGGLSINVETYRGTVSLSGFVDSQAEASRAVKLARDVQGVTHVKNDMRLKPAASQN